MGLDGVELIMAVEEKFDVAIPDEDAVKLTTPRLLMTYVERQLSIRKSSECLSQRAFHRLRRAAVWTLGVERHQFSINSRLEDLVPKKDRRRLWTSYGAAVEFDRWPELTRSPETVAVIMSLSIFPLFLMSWIGIGSALSAAGVLALSGFLATKPFAVRIPESAATVADLVRLTIARRAVQPSEGWSPESIRLTVRQIIIEQLGIRPDFSDDARFVEDLGVS